MEALDRPQIIIHLEKSLNYTVFDAKWIPTSAKFVVLGSHPNNTGAFQIYEMTKGELQLVTESVKKSSLKCGTFGGSTSHRRQLATGDFEGFLHIWDLDRLETPVFAVKAHQNIINAIDGCGGVGIGAPEIVTGGRDGCVKVWDQRQKRDPVAVMEPAEGEMKRDCWTVAFGNSFDDSERCVCAGFDNGDIKMFDLKTMSLRWETNVKNGVCSVEFDRRDIKMNKLVAATLESQFHIYDLRTHHPEKGFASLCEKTSQSTIWNVKHLPQNREIFATLGGGSLHLWKYSYPSSRVSKDEKNVPLGVIGSVGLLQNTTLSSQPVASLDWHPDKMGLCVCSAFDQMVRVCIVTKLNRV